MLGYGESQCSGSVVCDVRGACGEGVGVDGRARLGLTDVGGPELVVAEGAVAGVPSDSDGWHSGRGREMQGNRGGEEE